MWYLQMSTMIALSGMAGLLAVTRRWTSNKRILMLLFNLGFIYAFSSKLLLFYVAYTAVNYLGYLLLTKSARFRRVLFIVFVFGNIGLVSLFRFYSMGIFTSSWFDAVLTLGLIYNLLKVIDGYYFAYYVGEQGRAPALDYFNFILFVPTFTSGPILKFRDFMADTKQPYRMDASTAEWAVKRIILGLFKKMVLVTWLTDIMNRVLDRPELHTHESLFIMIIFYAIIYFDFSGYSDVAIGFGRLMGYNIPENFKKPFLSPTLTQYWRNWHATMADWFRDHIFLIFSRKSTSKWTAAGLSMLIMVLIGLWHGFSWFYVLWGVYHGLIISIENFLGKTSVNKKKVSRLHFYSRCLLTQALVTLAVIVYSGSPDTVLRIYRGLLNLAIF
jgi:alginate O-acetyltransferase complex protein AlgI